ncbi:hypothetical protein D3C80_2085500 [compost metagenome]
MDALDGIIPVEFEVGSDHKVVGCVDLGIKDVGRNRLSPGKRLGFAIFILVR